MLNNNKIYTLVLLTRVLLLMIAFSHGKKKKAAQGTTFLKVSKQFDSIYISYCFHFLDKSYAGLSDRRALSLSFFFP